MPFPRVQFLENLELEQIGHSEEHLVVQSKTPNLLEVGMLLFAFPFHICPTVALYDSYYITDGNTIIDQWNVIARDRKITI